MDIYPLITTGGFVIFLVVVVLLMRWDFRRQSYAYNLKRIPGFQQSQFLIGNDKATCIAIDDSIQKIGALTKRRGRPDVRVIPYQEVLSAEIIEDGNSVMRSSRSSQIGSAVVGGLVTMPFGFGIVGAVVGGLTGKKVSDDIVNRMDLVLVLNDLSAPRFTVNFLNVKSKKSSKVYKTAIQSARHWHSVFGAVIKRAETAPVAQAPVALKTLNVNPQPQLPPTTPKPPPPKPPERYFLYLNSEVKGPYLPSEIKVLCDVGSADGSTPLCREGEENWGTVTTMLG